MKFVTERVSVNNDVAEVLKELLLACVEGSGDNMTAMIVLFTNGEEYQNAENEFIKGPFFRGADDFEIAYKHNILDQLNQ